MTRTEIAATITLINKLAALMDDYADIIPLGSPPDATYKTLETAFVALCDTLTAHGVDLPTEVRCPFW